LALASCSSKPEKAITLGKSKIEYQGDSLNETHARRLGQFLASERLIDSAQDDEVTLIRNKDYDGYQVHLERDDSAFNKNQNYYRLGMWKLQDAMKYEVFNGQPVRLVLEDKDGKEIGPVGDMKIAHPNPAASVIYDPGFTDAQIANLSGFLDELSANANQPTVDVVVQKNGDRPVVHFFMEEGLYRQNTAAILKEFETVKYLLSKSVFGGQPVDVVINSLGFNELARAADPSPADKALLDQELAAQQAAMQGSGEIRK
jgi:hypothetical protein